jgi:hypothetical protein
MQRELLVTDDDGVTGVVPALVANDVIDALTEEIGGFPFALVPPLSSKEHDRRHEG